MRIRTHAGFSHPRQQLAERGVARQAGPHRQRVDKQTHQVLHARLIAPRNCRAHHHFLLPRIAGQKHTERTKQRHEERDAFLTAQGPKRFQHRRGKHHRMSGAMRGGHRRPGPVRRQFNRSRRAIQLLRPPGQLLL